MGEVIKEIENAIVTLKLKSDDIRLLEGESGVRVFKDLENHFVKSKNKRWWWEDFRQQSFSFKDSENQQIELLNKLIPDLSEKVWLMAEDDDEEFFPIFETRPTIIKDILVECFAFEYYIIDKKKEWLLCENHHNRFIGIGDKLKIKNLDRIIF